MPRALLLSEISEIIEEFRLGAVRALAAGFDGVELHGANGYLPDQFLQDGSNKKNRYIRGLSRKQNQVHAGNNRSADIGV